jgi:hypothetical protein
MYSPLRTSRLIAWVAIGLLSSAALTTFGQTTTQSFESVAELRASGIPASGTAALTGGYYVGADGGGNRFIWSANSTAADNGGTIIKPDAIASASAGRWLATTTSIFNVKVFGAKGDGLNDDTATFAKAESAAAAASEGTVYAPAGTYRVNKLVFKHKGVNLVGEGGSATVLICDLSADYVLQLGDQTDYPNGFKGRIAGLRVTRQPGTVTANTFGISALNFDDGTLLEDVEIDRHGVGLKTSDGPNNYHLGLGLNRVWFSNCTIYFWAKDVAELFVNNSHFGRNGYETEVPPSILMQFDGQTNDVRISKTQFLPRTENSQAIVFKWIHTTEPVTGYYRFQDINVENALTAFSSDCSATRVQSLSVTGSRLTPRGKLFDFDARSELVNLSFVNNGDILTTASTISGARFSRFVGNIVVGGLTFNGGDWVVSGNTFATDVNFTGAFVALTVANNTLVFNGSIPVALNVTGTGNISLTGNIADAGTQPPTVLSGDLGLSSGTTFGIDASVARTITIADNGFGQPFGNLNNFSGLFLLHETAWPSQAALFLVAAGTCVKVSETGTTYATTPIAPGTVNVYVNGAGAVEIHNQSGSSATFRAIGIRTKTSIN